MSTTITKLRAVVDATSVDEGAKKLREFGQTTSQVSSSSSQALGRVSSVLKGDFTGALMGVGAAAGVVTAGVAIAKVAVSMDDMRQRAANVRKELTAYAGGVVQARDATEAMLRATDGGISRMDAMGAASKLLGMGLATTSQQVYDLSRMAVMLGDKTLSVTDRMGSFNAMLANQSIERLDTFGISSGRVRARIEELQAAMPGLSREQAFVNATLEIGGEKLRDVETAEVDAASSMDKVGAALANFKQAVADKIHVQIVVDNAAEIIDHVAKDISGENIEIKTQIVTDNAARDMRDREAELNAILKERTDLQNQYNEAKQLAVQLGQGKPTWGDEALAQFDAQIVKARGDIESARIALELAKAAADQSGSSMIALGGNTAYAASQMVDLAAQARTAAKEIAETNRVRGVYMTLRGQAYLDAREETRLAEGSRGAQWTKWATPRVDNGAGNLVGDWVKRMEAVNKTVGAKTTDTIGDALKDAAREFETSLKGALQEGQRFSIGLFDLRPGGAQGANAPGQNGAFEDIYRLQAFVQNGSWSETAQKYGLDKDSATQRIKDFQSGKWTPDVMQIIDKDKLTQQIQDAQLGQAMQDAVIADLAKTSGADARIVKAMLGLGGATDGGKGAAALDLGGQLVPSLASAIDAELLSKGEDLKKRGAAAWDKLEEGMIDRASKSTKYVSMIEKMVDNALDNYVPPA